jgi:hypothetical protein
MSAMDLPQQSLSFIGPSGGDGWHFTVFVEIRDVGSPVGGISLAMFGEKLLGQVTGVLGVVGVWKMETVE